MVRSLQILVFLSPQYQILDCLCVPQLAGLGNLLVEIGSFQSCQRMFGTRTRLLGTTRGWEPKAGLGRSLGLLSSIQCVIQFLRWKRGKLLEAGGLS